MDTQPPVNAGGIKKHDEPSAAAPVTVAKDDGTAKVPGDSGVAASSAPAPAVEQEKDQDLKQKTPVEVGDDEDSDFDELDGNLAPRMYKEKTINQLTLCYFERGPGRLLQTCSCANRAC